MKQNIVDFLICAVRILIQKFRDPYLSDHLSKYAKHHSYRLQPFPKNITLMEVSDLKLVYTILPRNKWKNTLSKSIKNAKIKFSIFETETLFMTPSTHPTHKKRVFQTFLLSTVLSNRCSLVSSPEHEVLKVSYCDRSMSIVRCQQFALNDYSFYTPRPISVKLCRNVS